MRIQLDLDEAGVRLLDKLKEATGLRTHKELFNNAVTLFEWAVNQRRDGRIVASLDEVSENYKELQMPVLEYAASQAEESRVPEAVARSG